MLWNAINSVVAVLSLGIAAALWYRSVVAENPVADLIPSESGQDAKPFVLVLRVRNPGRHALILHNVRFASPPRADVGITVKGDRGVREDIVKAMRELNRPTRDMAVVDRVVPAGGEVIITVTLPDLTRPLSAWLYWSKQAPIVFPWRPTRVRRSVAQLHEMAAAADSVL